MEKKMYCVSGLNCRYYVWSDMPFSEIEWHAKCENEKRNRYMKEEYKSDVTVCECSTEEPFTIRYGGQPIYEWSNATDRYHCSYVAEYVVHKQNFIIEHGVKSERLYSCSN